MVRRMRAVIGPSFAAIRSTIADPGLRRLLIAWLASVAGKAAFVVVTFVVAYEAGGAAAVGVLGLAQFLPQMLIAPLAGLPVARWRPEVVLRAALAIRTLAIVAAVGAMAADLPLWVLIAIVVVEAGVSAIHRPIQMSMLPAVARTPEQLVGANVGSSAAEGLGTFIGPAVVGLLLVVSGPVVATVSVVVIYALGLLSIATLEVPAVGREPASARAVLGQLSAGFRTTARTPGLRVLIAALGFQTLTRGLLNVLIVVASVELLGMGDAGVGTLNAAIGLGGLIGALLATILASGRRLGPPFLVALAGWGVPIAVVGIVIDPVVAIVAMAAVGLSNAVLDVAAFTLLQRLTPNRSRVAVLGLVELIANGGIALGGVLAPFLIDAVGIEMALVVTGAILPAVAVVCTPFLGDIDEGGVVDPRRAELLRADPLFCPLPLATIEHLATSMRPFDADDGSWLIRQGERGDEYFLPETGGLEIWQDGQVVPAQRPGRGVGEIALLRDVPRTASVMAIGQVHGFVLDRAAFLEAVTGHPMGRAAAAEGLAERMAADAERAALH
jgi:hypothetical protein